MYSQKLRHSLVSMDHSHIKLFELGFACISRDRVFPWPHRGSIKANQLAKREKKITLNFKMPKRVVLGQGLGGRGAVLCMSAT